jgi:hypothetical protein
LILTYLSLAVAPAACALPESPPPTEQGSASPKNSAWGVPPCEQNRLDVARALYKSLVAQYPDKLITLYDNYGLMLARTSDDRDAEIPTVQ